jgi:uncharacterized membrane protein (DUF4010 family)
MRPSLDLAVTFAASAGIGLLVGIERERNPYAKAGLRTFALIAVLGTLCALLAREAASGWVLALVLAAPALALRWRAAGADRGDGGDDYRNPTNLPAALAFGALYALILFVAAWLSEEVGTRGVYGLAVVSGLTDVDAITLSSLQLFNTGTLPATVAAIAISLAVGANLVLKSLLVYGAGGRTIGLATMAAFAGPLAGLAAGAALLRWWA